MNIHLKKISLFPERFPAHDAYPFNLDIFHRTKKLTFSSPLTFFIGENGTGKSTLLKAIARRSGIHIWQPEERSRFRVNLHEENLYRYLEAEWARQAVPGLFFSSELFKFFSESLDEWASADPGILKYFGGKSLMTLSHGQALMSYFNGSFRRKGLFLLDEPETALSPKRQFELIGLLSDASRAKDAQFIIATHSPLLLSSPGGRVYCFDKSALEEVDYKSTEHYRLFRDFFRNKDK